MTERILETERLYLRELRQDDFTSLCRILQDEETMYAYEGAFNDCEAQEWMDRQIDRYQRWGFGFWAVILKETDEMISHCGLTMQPWKEKEVCSIIRDTNLASQRVALRNGMTKTDSWTKHYRGADMPHDRYVARRSE